MNDINQALHITTDRIAKLQNIQFGNAFYVTQQPGDKRSTHVSHDLKVFVPDGAEVVEREMTGEELDKWTDTLTKKVGFKPKHVVIFTHAIVFSRTRGPTSYAQLAIYTESGITSRETCRSFAYDVVEGMFPAGMLQHEEGTLSEEDALHNTLLGLMLLLGHKPGSETPAAT